MDRSPVGALWQAFTRTLQGGHLLSCCRTQNLEDYVVTSAKDGGRAEDDRHNDRRLGASCVIASFNLGECSGAGTTDRRSPGPSRHCTRERGGDIPATSENRLDAPYAQGGIVVGQAIENLLGGAAGLDQLRTTQFGQLLTERRLADARRVFDFADSALPVEQTRQDHEALGLGIDLELFGRLDRLLA